MPAVAFQDVTYAHGAHVVLDRVSATIPSGVVAGIIGPNGAGKTTLVELLVGLRAPQSGSITLFGTSPQRARQRGQIGYVPQRIAETALHVPATVEDVVESGRAASLGMFGRFTRHDRERVEIAMRDAGIEHLRSRHLLHISGGERQKTFIARALAADPTLLILDEPVTGVDEPSQEAFFRYIHHLKSHHAVTILLVLHDVAAIAAIADVALCLNRTISCSHRPSELLEPGALERLYGPHHVPLCHACR